MTTCWFGEDWGAPVCRDSEAVTTPVGEACAWCREAIVAGDDGFVVPTLGLAPRQASNESQGLVVDRSALEKSAAVYHHDCFLRTIVGGLNHQLGQCTCCGGAAPPDPPDLSLREAARAAVAVWRKKTPAVILVGGNGG